MSQENNEPKRLRSSLSSTLEKICIVKAQEKRSIPPSPFAEIPSSRPVLIVALIGGLLSMASGFLNALCLVLWDRGVTHVTGLITRTSINAIHDSLIKFLVNLLQLFCFLTGATISSFMVGAHRRFLGGYQYSPVLAAMGTILSIIALIGLRGTPASLVIAFVSGMQNAMSTFYSGAIVRTTHMTGTLTDIGIEIAKLARGMDEGWWKFQVLTCFLVCFFIGGVLGSLATVLSPSNALIFPIIVYYGLAIGNYYYHSVMDNVDKVAPAPLPRENSFDPGSPLRPSLPPLSSLHSKPSTPSQIKDPRDSM